MNRKTLGALTLLAAIAVPLAPATAAAPQSDVWSGKSKTHKLAMELVHPRSQPAISVSLSIPCDAGSGLRTYRLVASGRLKDNGKTVLESNAAGGGLKLTATAKKGKAATGSMSYVLAASAGGCSGTDTFKLKHKVRRG